jgi:opacity protein-like surface antigen
MMRKAALGVLMTAVVGIPTISARGDQEPLKNVVLADLGLHVIGAGYQRTLAPGIALQLDLESYTPWTQSTNLFGASDGYQGDLSGVALRFRPIFFGLFGTGAKDGDGAPTGVWCSPFGQFGIARASRGGDVRTGHVWALGAGAGYSWLLWGRFAILLGAGGQYHVANIPGGDSIPSFKRFYPTLDGNAGYAF